VAQILKRHNSYTIIVQAGRTADGKRKTKSATFKPSATTPKAIEEEVNEFARAFEKKVKEGQILDGESITFYDFANTTWKDWLCVQKEKPLRHENYERILKLRAYPAIGGMKLSKINSLHIQSIIDDMRKNNLSVATMKLTVASISSVFSCAVKKHIVSENPCKGERIDFPQSQKKEMQFFDIQQAQTFLSLLDSEELQLKVYFYLAIYGGFRREELIPITWQDVDFDNASVSINKTASYINRRTIVKPYAKTRGSLRDIILPADCMTLLKRLRASQSIVSIDGYVFTDHKGNMMPITAPYTALKRIIKTYNESHEDKLPDIRLHDLRHTTATILINAGVDIETVAKILGHSTVTMTLNRYGHSTKDSQKRAAETMQRLLANE